MKNYWLMKSEPDVFSIDDLKKKKREVWDGVRNYQARNFMRDDMCVGDQILFYHSNAEKVGIYGIAQVSKTSVVDPCQFDPKSEYFDEKSSPDNPRWICVEVSFVEKWKQPVLLEHIKANKALQSMKLVQKGQRLSVQPVSEKEFELILKMRKDSI